MSGTIADYLAASCETGETDIQTLIDTSEFPSPAVRFIASTCDFRIVDGHVTRVDPDPETWFPDKALKRRGSSWLVPVTVTTELLDGAALHLPMALGNVFQLSYRQSTSLDTGGRTRQVLTLFDDHVLLGPIRRQLAELGAEEGERVDLLFGPGRRFRVEKADRLPDALCG